jgi:hypothetical protein
VVQSIVDDKAEVYEAVKCKDNIFREEKPNDHVNFVLLLTMGV